MSEYSAKYAVLLVLIGWAYIAGPVHFKQLALLTVGFAVLDGTSLVVKSIVEDYR